MDENFDFFNYAGLHRPVKIYSTPCDYIEDIVLVPEVDLSSKKADVQISVKTFGQFDEVQNFVGEQLWNFADFQTKFGIMRVQGNKKGIFTRSREPKMVVRYLSDRWNNIPNFGYKK